MTDEEFLQDIRSRLDDICAEIDDRFKKENTYKLYLENFPAKYLTQDTVIIGKLGREYKFYTERIENLSIPNLPNRVEKWLDFSSGVGLDRLSFLVNSTEPDLSLDRSLPMHQVVEKAYINVDRQPNSKSPTKILDLKDDMVFKLPGIDRQMFIVRALTPQGALVEELLTIKDTKIMSYDTKVID